MTGNDGMDIVGIKIEKLFGKYDIDVDLSKGCNVLIGANGIGKTTILKLIYNLSIGNFIDLVSVPFAGVSIGINIEGEIRPVSVEYLDFFPTPSKIIEKYKEHFDNLEKNWTRSQYEMEVQERPFRASTEEKCAKLDAVLKELIEKGEYGTFLVNLFKKNRQPASISNVFLRTQIEELAINEIEKVILIEESKYHDNIRVFAGSEVDEYYHKNVVYYGQSLLDFQWDCLYFDLVQNYTISNSYVVDSPFVDKELEWVNSRPKKSFFNILFGGERTEQYVSDILKKEYDNDIFTSLFRSWSAGDNFEWKCNVTSFRRLKEERILDLNQLININYFPASYILEINNRASKYVDSFYKELEEHNDKKDRDEIEHEYEELKRVTDLFSDEIKADYLSYIKPILVRGSFFDLNINTLVTTDEAIVTVSENVDVVETDFEHTFSPIRDILYRKKLYEFICEVLPLCKDNSKRTKKINDYETIISKYMSDKYVSVRPGGIYIKDSLRTKDDNTLFILYDENDIDLSDISSGERKLLILFSIAIFGSYKLLLLDEPELSLSLVWQESLLPDVLSCCNDTVILAATHSPYIVRENVMNKFISYLPQKG